MFPVRLQQRGGAPAPVASAGVHQQLVLLQIHGVRETAQIK